MKRRRANECNFIKNKEYKYVLGKSMPPYTNLSLFLIISSKNYISHPKILMKSAATVVFVRKVSQSSSFKKDSQFNSNFFIGMWCCGYASLIRQTAFILKDKYQFLLFHTRKNNNGNNNFKSFLLWGICKSKLYSLDISTYITILNS